MDKENKTVFYSYEENHLGFKVKRIREIKGIKQEVICERMGISQPYLSKLENQPIIKDKILNQIAKAMEMEPEQIKNFKEASVQVNNHNSFSPTDTATATAVVNQYNYHPIEKVVELYERLIKSEKEKNEILLKLTEIQKPV